MNAAASERARRDAGAARTGRGGAAGKARGGAWERGGGCGAAAAEPAPPRAVRAGNSEASGAAR